LNELQLLPPGLLTEISPSTLGFKGRFITFLL
jgi:hypothetical protein